MHRRILIPALSLSFLCSGWLGAHLARAIPPALAQAQATAPYDDYMRQGYRATAKRQYSSAREFFRNALRLRPGDRYADRAIINVSRYIDQRGYVVPRLLAGRGTSAPGGSAFATTRAPLALAGTCKDCLFGLMPAQDDREGAKLLATVADYPSLLFYTQTASPTAFEFRLVYQGKPYILEANTPGVGSFVRINLASLKDAQGQSMPPLEPNQTYEWRFMLRQFAETGRNPAVKGILTRKPLTPALANTLQQASPAERVSLYAADDLWYDLISTLYDARRQDPQNSTLQAQWTEVLSNIQLANIAQKPLK